MLVSNPKPEISVIAPLWNEKLNVRPLAEQVFAALRLETRPIELLLVDDSPYSQQRPKRRPLDRVHGQPGQHHRDP